MCFSRFDKCSDSISHSQIALEEVVHGLHAILNIEFSVSASTGQRNKENFSKRISIYNISQI